MPPARGVACVTDRHFFQSRLRGRREVMSSPNKECQVQQGYPVSSARLLLLKTEDEYVRILLAAEIQNGFFGHSPGDRFSKHGASSYMECLKEFKHWKG